MRNKRSLVALTATGVLLGAPAAVADEQIVGTTPNRYANPDVTIDQGEPLTFRNADIARHDVTSTQPGTVRDHLFASDTIGNGETSFVEGSQYLTTGTYDYFCTIHPSFMKGTITVNASGTPKPRPGGGAGGGGAPPPDMTAPALSVTAAKARASTLKRGGSLRLTVGADEASTVTVVVRLKSARGARRKVSLGSAGSRKLVMALSRKVRNRLKTGSRLAITVTGTDAAGNAGSAKTTVKLR
jgi:plastocyanin